MIAKYVRYFVASTRNTANFDKVYVDENIGNL